MILWILALVLIAVVGLVGYYQGAVRAAFSFLGLLVAALAAGALGGLLAPLLGLAGLKHPILQKFLGPAIAFLLILVIFKIAARIIHNKLEFYYKHHDSDTRRLLFERLNTRVGAAVGVANGIVYFFFIVVAIHVLGYFTTQVRGSDNDPFATRLTSRLAADVQSTGMTKAISPFVPTDEMYYDASDVLGEVYHNPLLQQRLAGYPVFVTLAESPEFKSLAEDLKFQEFWLRQPRPSIAEVLNHEKVKPLIGNSELFDKIMKDLGGDLKDLKTYVETGKSPKYDDEKILGRWSFDYRDSIALARRNKPNIGSAELRQLRRVLGGGMANATLAATTDGRVILRTPSNPKTPVSEGTWKSLGGGKYTLTFSGGGKRYDLPAVVDGNQVVVTQEAYGMVFEK